jgi:hypothetical protein
MGQHTSNSFSLNGVSTNNLFNGKSAKWGENRFVLNTEESFGAGGSIQTSTSVYAAIGQALPTPPSMPFRRSLNASMYDATQGNNSGAHISVLSKSGTNAIHGSAWEHWQNSDFNAAPFFHNAAGTPAPFLNRNSSVSRLEARSRRTSCFTSCRTKGCALPIKRLRPRT